MDDERVRVAVANKMPTGIPGEAPSEIQSTSARRRMRVLAIDDDPHIRDLFTHALGTVHGYEVVTAANGEEGLELFHRQPPDCVIVDVQMSVMNGFQFLRAIRGDPASAHVPVIILSVRGEETYQQMGAYSGVDEYLPKPFKLSGLCESIQRVTQITPEERTRRLLRLAGEPTGDAG